MVRDVVSADAPAASASPRELVGGADAGPPLGPAEEAACLSARGSVTDRHGEDLPRLPAALALQGGQHMPRAGLLSVGQGPAGQRRLDACRTCRPSGSHPRPTDQTPWEQGPGTCVFTSSLGDLALTECRFWGHRGQVQRGPPGRPGGDFLVAPVTRSSRPHGAEASSSGRGATRLWRAL